MKTKKALLLIGFGTFILMIVGFYNGYPLVYSDTGTYILSGFEKIIPNDRPVTYGLFITLFDFDYSLWFVIFFQNLITAYVIFELLLTVGITRNFSFKYLAILLFLVLFTGIGWYTNQLMPDFFTPLIPIIIFILLKKENISLFTWITLSIIISYAIISHLSHILIGSTLILIIILLKYFGLSSLSNIGYRRILITMIIVLSGWLILPSINTIIEKKFILAKGSHVMFMAHLNQTGILKEFLDEKCEDSEFVDCILCNYKDSLPADLASFIWSDKEILQKCGGWTGSKEEFTKIINATLSEPKYLFLNIYKSLIYGFIQLTDNRIGYGLGGYNKGSPPYGLVKKRFPHELNDYLNSRENIWNGANLNLKTLNLFYQVLLFISLFMVLYIFTSPLRFDIDSDTILLLIIVILAIILNSFITAGLNAPYGRFQARIVWILPMTLLILLLKNSGPIKFKWQ